MSDIIFALVRFFKKESHRDDFLRGNLYMNRLRFFKAYEEEDACNIGDKHEGLTGWYQPGQVKLTIEDTLTGNKHVIEDFAGPVLMGLSRHNDYHVYCMSAIYGAEGANFESMEELRASCKLDVDKGDLGDYCAIVPAGEFMGRLDTALRSLNHQGSYVGRGLVQYYDPDTFSGSFDEDKAIFWKKNSFSHQKEFRFYVYDGSTGDDARTLNVGDLSDIAFNCHKADVNSSVVIELKD